MVPSITAAIQTHLLWPKLPILELGCGHYSTPLLASIAKTQKRRFELITSDPEWAKLFDGDPSHLQVIPFSNWVGLSFEGEWGLVLVDNEQLTAERHAQLFKLNHKAKVVVFHDANRLDEQGISWGLIQTLYKHVYFYDRYSPHTAILSNYINPQDWFQ